MVAFTFKSVVALAVMLPGVTARLSNSYPDSIVDLAHRELANNCHDCDCFTCESVSEKDDGTLDVKIGHCKDGSISWMCCVGTDGQQGNCELASCSGKQEGSNCHNIGDGEGLMINIAEETVDFTINTHDGKTTGDADRVNAVCGGNGNQDGYCAKGSETSHCLKTFNLFSDCGYTSFVDHAEEPEPEKASLDDPTVCATDVNPCWDGTIVSREQPDCKFAECPVQTYEAEPDVTTYKGGNEPKGQCKIPDEAREFSVVTLEDALISAHSMYYGIAIGGTLTDGTPSEDSTVDGTPSFINAMSANAPFKSNFNGGKTVGPTSIPNSFQPDFEYIAKHAVDSQTDQYMVKVFTKGGVNNAVTLSDFKRNGQEGQPNEGKKNLAIFNTHDDIYIDHSDLDRQFGATIIAPFSKVYILGTAQYVDGAIYCKELATIDGSDPNQGADKLQLHGYDYEGEIQCDEPDVTDAPTGSPTGSPDETDAPTVLTGTPTTAPTTAPTEARTDPPTNTPPGSFGDPHVKVWNGESFDFHGSCDLVLLDNPTFRNGLGMSIHIRTKIVTWWSFIETAVVRIGNQTLEVSGGNQHKYYLNGVEGDSTNKNLLFSELGFRVMVKQATGHQLKVRIDLFNADAIGLEVFKEFVRVNIKITDPKWKNFEGSRGLMGMYPTGVRFGRDGSTVFSDMNAFGQEWQVRESEPMLFHNVDGPQHPTKCLMPEEATAEQKRRRLGEGMITHEDADLACARVGGPDHDACVFDVLAANDKDMAGSY